MFRTYGHSKNILLGMSASNKTVYYNLTKIGGDGWQKMCEKIATWFNLHVVRTEKMKKDIKIKKIISL